jgi:heme-degrading monooxygenase HmoA
VEEYYVWTTTRRIEPGTRADFEQAWRPAEFPGGMLRAYELWSDANDEVVGVSFWDSRESCERFRASEVETKRREAMAPYVLDERSATYTGRELEIPRD